MSEETVSPNRENKPLRIQCITFGCQMNQYDTEVAEGFLKGAGYEVIAEGGHPERGEGSQSRDSSATSGMLPQNDKKPDIILMNTCSVREHAEERVYGRLGMLGKEKKQNPNLIVGLMGCMVEEHKEKLFKRFPQLDFMVGTRNIRELPALIEHVAKTREQVARIKQDGISIEYSDLIQRKSKFHAWLPVMTGCDKVCTYCIVPITRGAEVSMPAREVYREASRLVSEGVKWITLLGQNVNSYRGQNGNSPAERGQSPYRGDAGAIVGAPFMAPDWENSSNISFPVLLDMLCQIDGLERISFTTSHPQDATEELFQVIARNLKISRRFHLPLQSASDKILRRMKRLHTYEQYKVKIDRLRQLVPDVSITTDIIAGFSGETEEDHQATKRALEEIRYDSAFIYKYSLRPGTPAAKLPDDVPFDVKNARNNELLAIQKRITEENNRRWLGKAVEVFVEGESPKNSNELIGRTRYDQKVVFPGNHSWMGSFRKIVLKELKHETFMGETIQ